MNNITLNDLLVKLKEYNPDEVEIVKKAYEYADNLHSGQKRQSGEPYISHPLNVAYILAEMHADKDTICAGLLHDTLEDTDATEEDLRIFGEDVVHAVKLLTRAKGADEEEYVKNVLADPMAAVVKNADKISNLYDSAFSGIVGQVRSEKAKKFAKKYVEKARKYYAHKFSPALDDAIEKVDALLEDEYVRDWQTPNYTREEMRI